MPRYRFIVEGKQKAIQTEKPGVIAIIENVTNNGPLSKDSVGRYIVNNSGIFTAMVNQIKSEG